VHTFTVYIAPNSYISGLHQACIVGCLPIWKHTTNVDKIVANPHQNEVYPATFYKTGLFVWVCVYLYKSKAVNYEQ
jgi:hypothetical protein